MTRTFRHRIELLIATVALGSLRFLPLRLATPLSFAYGHLLDRAIPRLRRFAYINLTFAYPDHDAEWRKETTDGVFRSIGRLLLAFAQFPDINAANISRWIRYEGFEHYTVAKERGRGVLFATAHLGNWELSAFAHALMTEPMNVVVRPLDNPLLNQVVERRRGLTGNRLLSKREFARSILQALKNNEPVGILMDQNTAPDAGVFVPFFDRLACANVTFAKIAARSGAAVIPGFAVWDGKEARFVLKFYPEVQMHGDPVADTASIQSAIEKAVREYPDQWLWIHRRWKSRPAGESPIY